MDQRVVILAALDASSAAPAVAATAARFAAIPGGELHVVHVIDQPNIKALTAQLESARKLVEQATSALTPPPVIHLAAGAPVTEILQVASNLQADLLVLGTQELSAVDRLLLGSVVEPVARRAQCPVFIVRPKDYVRKVVPDIEKPCEACVAVQVASKGATLWCDRHAQRHVHGRLHYELPASFALGSSLLRPNDS